MSAAISCQYDGSAFDLLDPIAETVKIENIASALSKINRFNGHNTDDERGITVAEHSVTVSYLVPPQYAAMGLMHDAAESVVGDMPGMIKHLFPRFIEIENHILMVMLRKFQISFDPKELMPPAVKIADRRALDLERDLFMPLNDWWPIANPYIRGIGKKPLLPKDARRLFLNRFNELVDAGQIGQEHRHVY